MNVIAINSSPKMGKGNTATILTPFLDGMREAGAHVELLYTKEMKIGPCQGNLACWLKTPGTCPQKDDMGMLLPKLAAADVWVLATPVYLDGMNGPLKNLIDRVLPIVLPFYELRDGHCRHPLRESTTTGKIVLVSTCGFWEMDNFDPLLSHVKAISRNTNREFAGALLRPHIRAFLSMAERCEPVGDIPEAAKEAGRQLIQDSAMSSHTLGIISRPLLPVEVYVQKVNQRFQELLAEQ